MNLLVALDDSEPGWAALEYALEHHPEAEITVVHVVDLSESGYGEFAHLGSDAMHERRREQAEQLFETARDRASAGDSATAIETELLEGRPATEVVEYATRNPVDRVFVGSHGRTGVSRMLLGSVAERIARRAPVPVTIVR